MGQPRDDDDDDGDRGLNDSKWLEKWLLNRRFALTWKSKGVLLRDAGRTGFQRVVDKAHTNVHGWREWVTKNRTLTKWMSCDDDEWMSGYRPSCALWITPCVVVVVAFLHTVCVCLCFKSLAGCARPLHCNCSTHKFSPLLHAAVDLHACYDRLVGLFCVCFDKWDFMWNSHGDARPRWWCTKGYHRCAEVSLYMVVAF